MKPAIHLPLSRRTVFNDPVPDGPVPDCPVLDGPVLARRVIARTARGRTATLLATALIAAACSSGGSTDTAADQSLPSVATTTTTAPATTTTLPPTTTTTAPPAAPEADGTLRAGEKGEAVRVLQVDLAERGYWVGDGDGVYGAQTAQAVMAFQKVEGLPRDGTAGPTTLQKLATATRPEPMQPDEGRRVEIDLNRQVMFIVDDSNEVVEVHNTSTGRSGWRTPTGRYKVGRQIDGMRNAPLGQLWRPKYFNSGIAMHGSRSIPANPASHGCARLSFAGIDHIWAAGYVPVGTTVIVHAGSPIAAGSTSTGPGPSAEETPIANVPSTTSTTPQPTTTTTSAPGPVATTTTSPGSTSTSASTATTATTTTP